MMNKEQLVKDIIDHIGGSDNVEHITHCITRLRLNLKDDSKINVQAIEELDGVLGYTLQGNQHQIIIGTAVKEVYDTFIKIAGIKEGESGNKELTKNKKFGVQTILDVLTSIISPIIPAFCAAGMMKVVLLFLTTLGLCNGSEGAYVFFNMMADVAFYFLPVLIGISTAKRFNVDMWMGACIGASLLYPDFVNMVTNGDSLSVFGIHMPMYTYASTIFPALLGVILLSYVNRFLNKLVRIDSIRLIVVPLLSFGITVLITFWVLAPLGNGGAMLLGDAFTWMLNTIGPLAGLIIGFLMPVLTLTGLHQSLTPVEILEMTTKGFSVILPIEFLHNLAEAGSTFGTALSTKDKRLKTIDSQTAFTAFVGISEPALYGVMVRNKISMFGAMLGNGVAAFLGVLLRVKGYAFVWPNIFSIPSFLGENILRDLIALVSCGFIGFAVAFLVPFLYNKFISGEVNIKKVCSGKIIELSEVNDNVFSTGMCGKGKAIITTDHEIKAPCNGEVIVTMNHAVGLRLMNGAEVLIHFGLETNVLDESIIHSVVKVGDKVKSGQKLIEINMERYQKMNLDNVCIVVCTNKEITENAMTNEILFKC